jgi:pilus assembly protein CpaB
MNKWKAMVPIALALLIALAGSAYLYKYIKTQTAPRDTVKVESEAITVVVAAIDLPPGTKLQKEMIKTVPYFKEGMPSECFADCSKLEDRVTIMPLKQNELILASKLAPTSVTTGGVSAVVKPGKRAIAVKGDKVIGISGFIRPANRVDVLVTMKDPARKRKITKIVLEDVLVLATGTHIVENKKGEPSPVDVYTLEVDPEEGEKLALAASEGKLQFALRNVMDNETVLTNGATKAGTLRSFKKYQGGTRPNTYTVEIIKDGKVVRKQLKL